MVDGRKEKREEEVEEISEVVQRIWLDEKEGADQTLARKMRVLVACFSERKGPLWTYLKAMSRSSSFAIS